MKMTERSCGCTGIRCCLLCENGALIERNKKTDHERDEFHNGPRLFHYCLYSKIVTSGPWTGCRCFCNNVEESNERTADKIENSTVDDEEMRSIINTILMANDEVTVIENFVNVDEEIVLQKEIYKLPWKDSQSGRRKQDFGPKANFKRKRAKIGNFDGLPSFSEPLVKRMQLIDSLKDFIPVEVCHLEYARERGSSIDPHVDDNWLWGERLVTLSLCSNSVLSLTNDIFPGILIEIPMPSRSLLILQGSARHTWNHSIQRKDIENIRLAMTFRELSNRFLLGNDAVLGRKILDIASKFNGKPLCSNEK